MIELSRPVAKLGLNPFSLHCDAAGGVSVDDIVVMLRWIEESNFGEVSSERVAQLREHVESQSSEDKAEVLAKNNVMASEDGYVSKDTSLQVMQKLGILEDFQQDLDSFGKDHTIEDNHETQQKQEDIESSSHDTERSINVTSDLKQEDTEQLADAKVDGHVENGADADVTINEEGNDDTMKVDQDMTDSSVKKRGNGLSNMDLDFDSQRELGSPLKKMKLKPTSTSQNSSLDTLHEDDTEEIKNLADQPIVITTHDLEKVNDTPITLRTADHPSDAVDNDQKLKLETFLQRLLFPEAHESPSKLGSKNGNTNPSHTFENALYEVDLSMPQVPLNLNIPADEHGNTPLHWLTSIANIDLVKELVKHGASRLLGDNAGESALVKAVKSVNNYDAGTFEELLDYLYPCLILKDSMNRTILHHIVITSGMSRCAIAAKYYLDILMGWVVKKQTRKLDGTPDSIFQSIDLKWFINNLLNAQDSNGDTCLNIAARLGNVSIIDALLDYGADPVISNKSGLRPVDFGAGTSKLRGQKGEMSQPKIMSPAAGNKQVTELSSVDTGNLIRELETLLNKVKTNYEDEVYQYKNKLEKLHSQLNSQRELLATSRDRLAHTKQLRDDYALLKEQLMNIKQGIAEEEENFRKESEFLGFSSEEASKIDWNSSEFDADEPFRIDIIYDLVEHKLNSTYKGNLEELLSQESVESIKKSLIANAGSEDKLKEQLASSLPPAPLLKARLEAYRKNDDHLQDVLVGIKEKRTDLENKFRRVLSLCLKIEEGKVDDMLDGLLQAISSEDPQEIDTEEMQDFLKKHSD
ncbi:related to Regulatory protein SWI6 [Nakaseomyces glabratus]|nr:Ankyrin repeat profile [Nakaseomyces glabratus]QNG12354.1 SWI6 [Nakaseomyces glabratus]SCV14795.1 related to Regulatory protein SWI6 [Nakaseomyces glabratus]SLM13666.1 related to Regulatory protein SWI6 [Nakaseomyces glabratus]